jgi:hypothetical protein
MSSPPLTVDAYALRCGVTPRSVRQWRAANRLVVDPASGLIRPEESDRLRAVTARRTRAPRLPPPAATPAAPPAAPAELVRADALDPAQEKALLDKVRRQEIEHRLAVARGEIVGTKDITKFWEDAGARVRGVLEHWAEHESSALHATAATAGEHATYLFMRDAADRVLREIAAVVAEGRARIPTTEKSDDLPTED